MVKGSELAIWMGTGRNSTGFKKSLVLLGMLHSVVQCFTGNTNSIVRPFAPFAILLLLFCFFFFNFIIFGLNSISFHYFPISIPPQASSQ